MPPSPTKLTKPKEDEPAEADEPEEEYDEEGKIFFICIKLKKYIFLKKIIKFKYKKKCYYFLEVDEEEEEEE